MQNFMQSFKQQIDQMFQKTFQQLNSKNQLSKNILDNLIEAANQQSLQISKLDTKLQQLNEEFKNTNEADIVMIKKQVRKNQQLVHDNFNQMMYRLQQIEDGISNSRKTMQLNVRENQQAEVKIDKMINQMENIIAKESVPQYKGNRDMLAKQIEDFENMLKSELQKQRNLTDNLQFSKKTALQPLLTFQTKISIHNKANQQILKEKLSIFTDKIRKLEKKVQQTTWVMNSEISKSNQQQRKIIDEMNMLESQMSRLRGELEGADQKRKQNMQSHALSLDNMVEEMLTEAKRLEVRVESLRKGYEDQNQKLKKQIHAQKMTL